MKKIVIIGSTGSIGTQALNIAEKHKDKFEVLALVANSNKELLLEQKRKFHVKHCGLFSINKSNLNSNQNAENTTSDKNISSSNNEKSLVYGEECYELAKLAEADVIVVASSGIDTLPYLINAIKAKKTIAIANKECLVAAGEIVMPMVKKYGATLIPVDSEHSAIWQSSHSGEKKDIKKLLLTASGGPFLNYKKEDLKHVTLAQTLKHPNWTMGRKITVDSATMFNKGLEIIEAKWLFDMSVDNIEVVVHRESIIHSMVEFADSTVIAQMSYPSMEIPIQLALTYPSRIESNVPSLDFAKLSTLHFEAIDSEKFPAINLSKEVCKLGDFYPTIMNSANEMLVDRFINEKIGYLDIYSKVEKILAMEVEKLDMTIENIIYISNKTKRIAETI